MAQAALKPTVLSADRDKTCCLQAAEAAAEVVEEETKISTDTNTICTYQLTPPSDPQIAAFNGCNKAEEILNLSNFSHRTDELLIIGGWACFYIGSQVHPHSVVSAWTRREDVTCTMVCHTVANLVNVMAENIHQCYQSINCEKRSVIFQSCSSYLEECMRKPLF